MLREFINKVAYLQPSQIPNDDGLIYHSRYDNSYFTHQGLEKDFKFYLRYGITEDLQNTKNNSEHTVNIGFNPEEQKWYGWSHRAIFGFGIGSKCEKGNCGYNPKNKEDFKQSCLVFWGDLDMDGNTHKVNSVAREETRDNKLGIYVEYTYDDKILNVNMRNKKSGMFTEYPTIYGRGEWEAKTLLEAKQMAIDFANNI